MPQGLKAWIRGTNAQGLTLEEEGFFARIQEPVESGTDVLPDEVPETLLRRPVKLTSEQFRTAFVVAADETGKLRVNPPRG